MAKRAYSPREILKKSYRTLPWTGDWAKAFGTPTTNETWFISGASASGKSSFVMQLARELCKYGTVLYLSYEEGISQSFQTRIERFKMSEVQGKFRVATSDTYEDVIERLKRPKSPNFVIIDSFQYAEWTYPQAEALTEMFARKSFIFISQENKGQPLGKPAVRLKYMAGVKVRVVGYQAVCQGRFIPEPGVSFKVWEEGLIKMTNKINA
jgi:predicted ATP-dependent serine protease